jgi:hypothetical protein
MSLQSQLLRGDPKLQAAAISDPAHIVPGARGPHVTKIQQALIQAAGAAIEPDGMYGPATAAAVADFKRKRQPPILNFAGAIDNIVGIKTIAALNTAMLQEERGGGRLRLNFDVDVTLVDIVVNLIGAAGSRLLEPEEALPKGLVAGSYDPVAPDPLDRKFLRHKTSNNLLFRLAHSTNEIGPGSVGLLLRLLLRIVSMLRGTDPANGNLLVPGKIFVLGSSSGGRNAITFAGMLAQGGFQPQFVASIDATFFQADTPDRPIIAHDPVAPIPIFPLTNAAGRFAAVVHQIENRHNFFQSQGNHAKRVLNPLSPDLFNFLFTSNMAGGLEEIHGQVESFHNHLIKVGNFGPTDDDFHEECDASGRRQAQELIARDLR